MRYRWCCVFFSRFIRIAHVCGCSCMQYAAIWSGDLVGLFLWKIVSAYFQCIQRIQWVFTSQWRDIIKRKVEGKRLISNLHSIHSKLCYLSFLFIDHLAWNHLFFLFSIFFVRFIFCCYWSQMQTPYTLHYILNIQWSSRWLSNISVIETYKFIKHEMGFMPIYPFSPPANTIPMNSFYFWKKKCTFVSVLKKEWNQVTHRNQ